ncbi:hypothetical protein ACFLXI_07690 [Chloroflexota bacterium]
MTEFYSSLKVKYPNRIPFLVLLIGLLFVIAVSLACNAPGNDESPKDTQIALNLQETQSAIQENQAEMQSAANDQSAHDTEATQTAQAAIQIAADVQATIDAHAAIEAASVTDTSIPTDALPPTVTSEPTVTNPPPTDPPPTDPPSTDEPVDRDKIIEDMIKDADILLFENVTKIPLPRYIKQALDNLGLSRNYVDTKDAPGNFKAQLLSGIDWDLIIAGVEARSSIQGEFFDYFNEEVNEGTALVLEIWNLDEIAGAKATSFLTNCGIKVQGDWYDPPMTARSIWWLYGEHPVFHEPNEGMSLVNYNPYWSGDAGDLLKTVPGSDAILLAGTYAQEKNSHGVLATCHDDRVIIQTYSSHDYRQDAVVRLWENYIYNALRAHFELVISQ